MTGRDPADAAVRAAAVAGLVDAAFVAWALLANRSAIVASMREALPAAAADANLSLLFWVTLAVGPATVFGIDLAVGGLFGVVYDRLGEPGVPAVVGFAALAGVVGGYTTNVSAGRELTVAASLLAWAGFAVAFVRLSGREAVTGEGRPAHQQTGGTDGTDRDYRPAAAAATLGLAGVLGGAVSTLLSRPDEGLRLAAAFLVGNGLLVVAAALVGARLGERTGLGTPRLQAWFDGADVEPRRWGLPVALGAGAGVAIVALDVAVFQPLVADAAREAATGTDASLLVRAPLVLYGGLAEEVLFRYGLLTAVVWVGLRVTGRDRPGPALGWTAVLAASLAFGVAHLPATAGAFALTPAVVARGLVLNGVAGVAFGWLYWRRGLLAAMAAHVAADVVLQVAVPVLVG